MQRGKRTILFRRMQTLGVPDTLVEGCDTIGDLQGLAKPYYRAMARRWHPDHAQQRLKRHCHNERTSTARLRAVIKTYAWLMDLDPLQRIVPKPPFPVSMLEREYADFGWGFQQIYL
jgi:hypothetical protein